MENNIAIILAGGNGTRFEGKKQFIKFMGKTLWEHVYDKTLKVLPKENIIVVGVDIKGGKTRSYSVINGLNYFNKKKLDYKKVIILESARPLVRVEQIEFLLKNTQKSSTYIMPLVNTVIKRDGTYCNRNDYYDLLTPQCFDFKLLHNAYNQQLDWDMTDETRLMYETYDIKPEFFEGGENLIKLTYKKDLPIIEHIYKMMEENII